MSRRLMLNSLIGLLMLSGIVAMITATPAVAQEKEKFAALILDRHCAVELQPLEKGAKESKQKDLGCFETYSEVVSAATNGAVKVPADTRADQVGEEQLNTRVRILIGKDWDLPFYRGRSVTWFTNNPSGCFDGSQYAATYAGSSFDDRLSSTKAYSGCQKNISYYGYSASGSGFFCSPNCPSLRAVFNNRASSKRWKRR